LQEQLETLRVELNREKTKMVDTLKGEAFGFLGFDLRRVHKRKKDGYTIQMTPKKKARKVVKAKIRDIIRSGGATPRGGNCCPRQRSRGRLGQLLPGRQLQSCLQRGARLSGNEDPHSPDATQAAAKDQHRMVEME
jgi:hypothetical protein